MATQDIQSQINKVLADLQKQAQDLSPVMEVISALVNRAIQTNFSAGGRWDGSTTDITIFSGGSKRWTGLARTTKSNYRKKNYELTPTLHRSTAGLKSTIEVRPDGKAGIMVTANSPYAAIHQHGGTVRNPGGTPYIILENKRAVFISKKKASKLISDGHKVKYTKPHLITIPPRPYIVLSPEDFDDIMEIIEKYVTG